MREHIIELEPTDNQVERFNRARRFARLAYEWAVAFQRLGTRPRSPEIPFVLEITHEQFEFKVIKNQPYIHIPNVGLVKMCEPLKGQGRVLVAKILKRDEKWILVVAVDAPD